MRLPTSIVISALAPLCFQSSLTAAPKDTNKATNIKELNTPAITKNITPKGWMKEYLVRQETGLTGHPAESGFPFNTQMWEAPMNFKDREFKNAGSNWWPYEQTAYYLDGALRVGYMLKSKPLLDKAHKSINHVLSAVKEGERINVEGLKAPDWPLVIFNRMLFEEYENTKDPKILKTLEDHYSKVYGNIDFAKLPLKGFAVRTFLHVENLCTLYQFTGDKKYLDMAVKLYSYFDEKQAEQSTAAAGMLKHIRSRQHAVTQHNFMGLPAILYFYTKNPYYLKAITAGYESLKKDNELTDGLSSGYERMHGKRSDFPHETCNVIDFIWSCGWLSLATEETRWADKIEKVFFNAGMGSITPDFKAHQYYSSPNQVILTDKTSHWNGVKGWGKNAQGRLCYRPGHDTECCSGNIHRMAPSYTKWMWFSNQATRTLTASLYAPTEVDLNLTENDTVHIAQVTNYPFENSIKFVFKMDKPQEFTFQMRVPGWSQKYQISLNGKEIQSGEKGGLYAKVKRQFKTGDQITLNFETQPVIDKTKKGVAINYGPLVYSLPVKADTKKITDLGNDKASEAFPAYEDRPASPWAYALSKKLTSKDIKVIHHKQSGYAWETGKSSISLQVPAREVTNWKIKNDAITVDFPKKLELGKEATLELIPLGKTILRITEFPQY